MAKYPIIWQGIELTNCKVLRCETGRDIYKRCFDESLQQERSTFYVLLTENL